MDHSAQKAWAGKIVYFSRFQKNPSGNGGDKRIAQICEALDPFGCQFVSMLDPTFQIPEKLNRQLNNPSNFLQKKYSIFLKQCLTNWKYFKWSECFRNNLLYMHVLTQQFCNSLKNSKPALLIIDDPVFLAPAVRYATTQGVPLVAFCHNIETLSREQIEFRFQREMLKYELDLISKCDLVVTISKEETFLLRNLGVNPVYLPYFPVEQTTSRLKVIRNKRLNGTKANYLLLGTAYNLPTLAGMKLIISAVSQNNFINDDNLIIVGYGTNELLDKTKDSRIEIRGAISDTELDDILTKVKGCIVYQDSGAGALTKIPELHVAGVPVIINSHAARSHHHLPGIFEFETFGQLGDQMALAAKLDQFPQVLSTPDITTLQKSIAKLIQEN